MTKEEINVAAFLKLIRFAEHGTDNDSVYFLLYGGKKSFTDVTKHPNNPQTAWGRTSTAAGAYQILAPTWQEAKERSVVSDFSKASQDKLALAKLRSRGALLFVQQGDIESAITRTSLRKEWASLPGASQSNMTMQAARERFNKYVQELSRP
ncbi:glycoside hydrolase family 104 protein [Neisseriaceae bacterium TC5R-5]|nr:glycoside hydrolase family 104 protein [Neisseriaceae bacterium TC5R-5]